MGKQGVLDLRVDKNGQRRGGKRKGAGRPARGPRPSEKHEKRCAFTAQQPVHVVARVVPGVGNLRRGAFYAAIREATIAAAKRYAKTGDGARIVHLSIQRSHLHLLVEAHDNVVLARGMQSFLISAAKQINRTCGRRGAVFGDRYHATVLRTPRQVRNCLSYVMNNWRHHGEDRGYDRARAERVGRAGLISPMSGTAETSTRSSGRALFDPFSSGISFTGWMELEARDTMFRPPPTYRALIVWLPKTWLLAVGWRKSGVIGAFERPGGCEKSAARR